MDRRNYVLYNRYSVDRFLAGKGNAFVGSMMGRAAGGPPRIAADKQRQGPLDRAVRTDEDRACCGTAHLPPDMERGEPIAAPRSDLMFPIRDDNPHFLTPYTTYGIIAL